MNAADLRRWFAGPDVLTVVAVLVLPLLIGTLDSRFLTPLAYPGYLLHALGTAAWNRVLPNFALWVFWGPFVGICYAIGVVVAAGYRAAKPRLGLAVSGHGPFAGGRSD